MSNKLQLLDSIDGFNPESITNMTIRANADIIFKNWKSQPNMTMYDFHDIHYSL